MKPDLLTAAELVIRQRELELERERLALARADAQRRYELKGEPGERGPQGDRGLQGDRGVEGPQGVIGPIGPEGQRGAAGLQGERGDTGAPGPEGVPGKRGVQGPRGERGITGPGGPKGGEGLRYRGAYDPKARYEPGDVVEHLDSSWVARAAVGGDAPSETSKTWGLVARAGRTRWVGMPGLNHTPVGVAPNDAGFSYSQGDNTLTLEPADGTHPGLVSVLAQAFAGVKTFLQRVVLTGGIQFGDGTIQTSAAVSADLSAYETTAHAAATYETQAAAAAFETSAHAASTYATAASLTTHAALTAAHGVAGAVVGTTDTQNLSHKTFTDTIASSVASGGYFANVPRGVYIGFGPSSGDGVIYSDSNHNLVLYSSTSIVQVSSGSLQAGAFVAYTNQPASVWGDPADGATAVGVKSGFYTAKTTVGAKIHSFFNGSTTEKRAVGKNGQDIFPTGQADSVVGTATLSGGTVTVSTTAVSAASKIFLSHSTPAGTPGILSQGTIVAATSFVINSTSGSDTSTVNWWIVN